MNMAQFSRIFKAMGALFTDKAMIRQIMSAVDSQLAAAPGECLICGYKGKFAPQGRPLRTGARCLQCGGAERHRLFALAVQREFFSLAGKRVLHFAPERAVKRIVNEQKPASYVTSAYPAPGAADLSLNIEKIDLLDESFDTIICSHVLEHVDDRKALRELLRILSPGGELVAAVPIVHGWDETYEDPTKVSESDRLQHFLQEDHVRLYGSDIRDRFIEAGFALREFIAGGADSVKYRLARGGTLFVGTKPS